MVEEMLHLTLAANILNAVGGNPDLTASAILCQSTPHSFRTGRKMTLRSICSRSPEKAVETFLKIERPRRAPSEGRRVDLSATHRQRGM